jgi:hypothetical protein
MARCDGAVFGPAAAGVRCLCRPALYSNEALLPTIAGQVTRRHPKFATLIVAATILLPQIIVALNAPWIGRTAERAGRHPMLLLGEGIVGGCCCGCACRRRTSLRPRHPNLRPQNELHQVPD